MTDWIVIENQQISAVLPYAPATTLPVVQIETESAEERTRLAVIEAAQLPALGLDTPSWTSGDYTVSIRPLSLEKDDAGSARGDRDGARHLQAQPTAQ